MKPDIPQEPQHASNGEIVCPYCKRDWPTTERKACPECHRFLCSVNCSNVSPDIPKPKYRIGDQVVIKGGNGVLTIESAHLDNGQWFYTMDKLLAEKDGRHLCDAIVKATSLFSKVSISDIFSYFANTVSESDILYKLTD